MNQQGENYAKKNTRIQTGQKARVPVGGRIIYSMTQLTKPSHTHTCDICQGEFPCWQQNCPIAEQFICDDCADDALKESGESP